MVSYVGDGGQGGGAGGGEGDGSAVGDQGHHTGGHRREPQTHQQRRCQRRWRAESGRAFDERPKEVADDDGLDAGVGGDGLKAAADDIHQTGFFQCILQEDGACHDEQQINCFQNTVNGICRRVQRRHLPDKKHQKQSEQKRDAHRFGGGDVAQNHKEKGQQQRDGG